jgi:hypothetical protein
VAKQYSQIFTTEEGMQIDRSNEHLANAFLSIHNSLDPRSKVTLESDLEAQKQYWPSVVRHEGMQIDENDGAL